MDAIIEALGSPSKGRLKVIQAAYEAGAFVDKKLAELALQAIDDSNAKVADYVATIVLPTLGPKNHKWLARTANPKNMDGYVRRIALMHQIDPLATQPLVRKLAKESPSRVVRALAIECLSALPDNFPLLVEIYDSKDNCFWALCAIAKMGTPESNAFILDQLNNENIYPLIRVANDIRPAGLVEAAIALTREMLTTLSSETEISIQQSIRFRNLVDIATAKQRPFGTLSAESEALLIHCLDYVPTLLSIDMANSDLDMVCRMMRRLAYDGSRAGCMFMIEHQNGLPAEYHSLISSAANRNLSPEERDSIFPCE